MAYKFKNRGEKVTIVDLDIVNPYFRTKDDEAALEKAGIDVVVSRFANSNVDTPSLPPNIYSAFEKDGYVIFDVGGDDDGAVALGRFYEQFAQKPYDMLGIVNTRRPLTRSSDEIVQSLKSIETVSRLKFTGIVNNTNLSVETDSQTVLQSIETVETAADKMGCGVKFVSAENKLADKLHVLGEKLFPMEIRLKKW